MCTASRTTQTGANVTGIVANRRIFRVECAGLDDGRYGTNFDDLMVFSLPRICNYLLQQNLLSFSGVDNDFEVRYAM